MNILEYGGSTNIMQSQDIFYCKDNKLPTSSTKMPVNKNFLSTIGNTLGGVTNSVSQGVKNITASLTQIFLNENQNELKKKKRKKNKESIAISENKGGNCKKI